MKLNKLAISMVLVGAALSSSAHADPFVFGSSGSDGGDDAGNGLNITTTTGDFFVPTSSSGWWNSAGTHDASNPNYIAGVCCEGHNYNNFFTFDLSSVAGSVLSATLRLNSSDVTDPLTYSLFDITSSLSDVRASGNNLDIYRDLMSGANYGSFSYSSADSHEFRSITLNNIGISALNSGLGGEFGIGGSVEGAVPTIPEPETYAMLLAGLGLIGCMVSRKKAENQVSIS